MSSMMSDQPLTDQLRAWRGCTPEQPRGGISQRRAAELLGIPLRTYQGLEQGKPCIYAKLLVRALAHITAK